MNFVDRKFYSLVKEIEGLSFEKLYDKIVFNYKFLPSNYRNILEEYFKKFSFWGSLSEKDGNFEEIELKVKVLKSNLKDFVWLYKKLEDYTSKFLLYSILRNWVYYDFTSLGQIVSPKCFKHYFDLNLIRDCKNEVFVDVGAYVGDSTLDFISTYGEDCYKKIYCYEITDGIISSLKENLKKHDKIEIVNKAVGEKDGEIFLSENLNDNSANRTTKDFGKSVPLTSLDLDVKEKITMIKMDIEGDEEKAIRGARRHIANDSPKLLLSVYHKNEDYFKIAKLVNSYNKNYKFYLRNYGGNFYPTEIVLFALPKQ